MKNLHPTLHRAGQSPATRCHRYSSLRAFVCASVFAALASQAEVPKGWFAPPAASDYEATMDRQVRHTGKTSVRIANKAADPQNFGNLMQSFAADDYRGKRVRFTGYVKTADATAAQFWMRVDGQQGPTAFDNMDNRRVTGTVDWTKCEVVLDVTEDATAINFGCMLIGTGKLWFDDMKFEVVNRDVPVTDMEVGRLKTPPKAGRPKAPQNLDLEAAD